MLQSQRQTQSALRALSRRKKYRGWLVSLVPSRPVNLKEQPPQTDMITDNIGTWMDVCFDIRIRDSKPHSNVPKPSIAPLGEPCRCPRFFTLWLLPAVDADAAAPAFSACWSLPEVQADVCVTTSLQRDLLLFWDGFVLFFTEIRPRIEWISRERCEKDFDRCPTFYVHGPD